MFLPESWNVLYTVSFPEEHKGLDDEFEGKEEAIEYAKANIDKDPIVRGYEVYLDENGIALEKGEGEIIFRNEPVEEAKEPEADELDKRLGALLDPKEEEPEEEEPEEKEPEDEGHEEKPEEKPECGCGCGECEGECRHEEPEFHKEPGVFDTEFDVEVESEPMDAVDFTKALIDALGLTDEVMVCPVGEDVPEVDEPEVVADDSAFAEIPEVSPERPDEIRLGLDSDFFGVEGVEESVREEEPEWPAIAPEADMAIATADDPIATEAPEEGRPCHEDPELAELERYCERCKKESLNEDFDLTDLANEIRKDERFAGFNDSTISSFVRLYCKDTETMPSKVTAQDFIDWAGSPIDALFFEPLAFRPQQAKSIIKADPKALAICRKYARVAELPISWDETNHGDVTDQKAVSFMIDDAPSYEEGIREIEREYAGKRESLEEDKFSKQAASLDPVFGDMQEITQEIRALGGFAVLPKGIAEKVVYDRDSGKFWARTDDAGEIIDLVNGIGGGIHEDLEDGQPQAQVKEEAHPQEAQPKVDMAQVGADREKMATAYHKPVIYGYMGSDHHGNNRYFEIDPIVCDDLAKEIAAVKARYRPTGSVLVAYPQLDECEMTDLEFAEALKAGLERKHRGE